MRAHGSLWAWMWFLLQAHNAFLGCIYILGLTATSTQNTTASTKPAASEVAPGLPNHLDPDPTDRCPCSSKLQNEFQNMQHHESDDFSIGHDFPPEGAVSSSSGLEAPNEKA